MHGTGRFKQQLSSIWSWTHEKVKQHRGWVEKRVAYEKKRVTSFAIFFPYTNTRDIKNLD